MSLRANYHTHTTWCDGTSTPKEIVEQALKLGFDYLGFSGHMDADIHMDYCEYAKDIWKLKEEYKDRIEILCGVELDNLYDAYCANQADYIIGSTHFLDVKYERLLSIDDKPEDVIKTLLHEARHAYQHAAVKSFNKIEKQLESDGRLLCHDGREGRYLVLHQH